MCRTTICVACCVGLLLFVQAGIANATVVYNANDDFSLTNGNPNGVWTYGQTDFAKVYPGTPGYVMTTPWNWESRTDGNGPVNIDAWGMAGGADPQVTHNGSGAPISDFGCTWGANDIVLDCYGGAAIVQWKAPVAGTAVANVTFGALSVTTYEGFNGVVVKTADGSGGVTWSDTFTVNAGDCIAFATGGSSLTVFHETITVTSIPEPSTVVLLGSGLFGLLCYAWRKRK